MNKCPKCGAKAPALLSPDRCPFCLTYYNKKKKDAFLKKYEERQQLDILKAEIIIGKEYADRIRERIKKGEQYSLHLDPQYANLSLDELKKLFGLK